MMERINENVRCFDEKDSEGLSNLFNQSAHDSFVLDAKIKEAFNRLLEYDKIIITCLIKMKVLIN